MSKLANEIYGFLKLGGSFLVAEKRYLKCTLITKRKAHQRVCFFFLEKSGTDRFEDLNADVRWTSACRQLDGGNSFNFLSIGKKIATNLAGTFLHAAACGDKMGT